MLPWIFQKNNFKKIATVFAGVLFVAIFLFFADSVSAQVVTQNSAEVNFGLQPIQESVGLASGDIRLIVARIIRAVLGLLGIIAIVIIIWAGYTIMTAGGNEEKIGEGKKILINAVIGLAIILSAFSIAQFVINALMKASGMTQTGDGTQKIQWDTFAGSGALGKVIKDHYPERNQIGVPRNTKIMVTFAEPIEPSSFINNTNNTCWPADISSSKPVLMTSGGGDDNNCLKDVDGKVIEYFGDCDEKESFSWKNNCDQLNLDKISITNLDTKQLIDGAAVMTTYDENRNAYVFVFRPVEFLGDNIKDVWYSVNIGNEVKNKNGQGIFSSQYYKYYQWQFQTNTLLDFNPPTIVSVSPQSGKTSPRNKVIRINFSEAMDPTMVQGVLSSSTFSFRHIIFNTTTVSGAWSVSNGYKTVEFVSDIECGLNSCGLKMYCLPVSCPDQNDFNCINDYSVLVRAGLAINSSTFEAVPFSGVMDASGNALDGNKDGIYNTPPPKGENGDWKVIGSLEKSSSEFVPDNFGWSFKVANKIDREAPYLRKVLPRPDEGNILKDGIVKLYFSKPMFIKTLQEGVSLEEYSPSTTVMNSHVDFPYLVRSQDNNDGLTDTQITVSRGFGPNNVDYYYYSMVSSSVQSDTQNCLYPGYGPDIDNKEKKVDCFIEKYDDFGTPVSEFITNCVMVNFSSSTDTGCVHSYDVDSINQKKSDIGTCLDYLKQGSISPSLDTNIGI